MSPTAESPAILSVRGLTVVARQQRSGRPLVSDVSFELGEGECLGLVGESGSGKSLTLRSIIGILPRGVSAASGELLMRQADAPDLRSYNPRTVRGSGIGMIFQEPMRALNPLRRVGPTLAEPLRQHQHATRREAHQKSLLLLEEIGITDVDRIIDSYPHQLSGGQRQRVMIAASLACQPQVLLCDEPTTALDVTTQAGIVRLLRDLMQTRHLSLIFVSHNLAVIRQVADRVAVMYAGELAEIGPTSEVLAAPAHVYTRELIGAVPSLRGGGTRLVAIPGTAPTPADDLPGCRFAPRCPLAESECRAGPMQLTPVGARRASRCRRAEALIGGSDRP